MFPDLNSVLKLDQVCSWTVPYLESYLTHLTEASSKNYQRIKTFDF